MDAEGRKADDGTGGDQKSALNSRAFTGIPAQGRESQVRGTISGSALSGATSPALLQENMLIAMIIMVAVIAAANVY